MKLVWAGTFDPVFSRNRKLARLLELSEVEVRVVREEIWGTDRIGLATTGRLRAVVVAIAKYPRLLARLLLAARPDIYLVSYPGWLDMLLIRPVAWLKRRPVVFDPFIGLSDTIIGDRQLFSPHSFMATITLAFDRWSLRLADMVIGDTPTQIEFYREVSGGRLKATAVIPVGADDSVFAPSDETDVEEGRVLFYGTLVPLHGISTVVEAAALLDPLGIHMTIIGDGQDRPILEEAIERTGASLDWRGVVPLEALPRLVARATVCLGIFGDSSKAGRVVPHKVFECLAMGRPVVTRDGPAVRSLFMEDEIIMVPPDDARSLAEAIRSLMDDAERRDRVARAGRKAYRERFHESITAETLRSVLSALTKGNDSTS